MSQTTGHHSGTDDKEVVYPRAQTHGIQSHLLAKKNTRNAKENSSPVNSEDSKEVAFPPAEVSAIDQALATTHKKSNDVKAKAPQASSSLQRVSSTPLKNAKNVVFPKQELGAVNKVLKTSNSNDQENAKLTAVLQPVEEVEALGKALETVGAPLLQDSMPSVQSVPDVVVIEPKPVPDKTHPAKLMGAEIEPTKQELSPVPRPGKLPVAPPALLANIEPKPTSAAAPTKLSTAVPSKPFTNPFKLPKIPKIPKLPSLFGKKPGATSKPPSVSNIPNPPTSAPSPSSPKPALANKPDKSSLFSRLFGRKPGKDNEGDDASATSTTARTARQQPEEARRSAASVADPLATKQPILASLPRQLPASYPPRTRGIVGDDSPDKERGYPRIPAVGNDFGLNEPPASARFFDKTKSALFADPLDPKRLEQIFKEFQRFAANIASVSTSMINNLKTQTGNFKALVAKTDERRRNDLYTNFLTTLDKVLDRYMQLHKVFLIDNNFSKKLQYAWRYAPEVAQQQVDAFIKNVIDPYFANIAEITANAMPKHMVGGGTTNTDNETSSPGVYYAYEKYLDRLQNEREKLYDFYYNKASNAMLQWTSTHTLIYSMKLLRVLFLWMALYLTSKTFQARYVQKVFADNEDPPRLETFVLMFWALEAVLMVFVFIILYLIKYLLNSDSNFIVNDGVIGKFLGDYIASTVLIVLAGLVIGRIMMKKKYFRYKSDGLRAIRSFEEVMWYISIFILAFPFFVIF
jgi:hypothetical protein